MLITGANSFGGYVIGTTPGTHDPVEIERPSDCTYLIGRRGSGKSTVALNNALEDIRRADKAVVLLDPTGDLANDIIYRCPREHTGRVDYFSPVEQEDTPFSLNPFEIHDLREDDLRTRAILDMFLHLWYGDFSSYPNMQNTLGTLIRSLLYAYPHEHTHFGDLRKLLLDDKEGRAVRAKLYAHIGEDLAIKWTEWNEDFRNFQRDTGSSINKILFILQSRYISNILRTPVSSKCFDFNRLFKEHRVLIVNLHGLNVDSQKLLGSAILSQLIVTAKSKTERGQRIPCHVYADEFHFFPTAIFEEIINQLRKFGLFCTIANQSLYQLDKVTQAAARSCGTQAVFRVSSDDANLLRQEFRLGREEDALKWLPRYEALVKLEDMDGDLIQVRVLTFPPKGTPNEEVARSIRERSIRDYGRKPQEEIKLISNEPEEAKPIIPPSKGKTAPKRFRAD